MVQQPTRRRKQAEIMDKWALSLSREDFTAEERLDLKDLEGLN